MARSYDDVTNPPDSLHHPHLDLVLLPLSLLLLALSAHLGLPDLTVAFERLDLDEAYLEVNT